MSSPWTYALVIAALAGMVLAWHVPRAWMWTGIGGASFFASTLYFDYGNQVLHPIMTLACDSLVCLAIYRWAKEKWEILIFLSFWLSVLTSLLMIGGFIPDRVVYASFLEIFNLCAILAISGTGIVQMIGKYGSAGFFHNLDRYLHSARNTFR